MNCAFFIRAAFCWIVAIFIAGSAVGQTATDKLLLDKVSENREASGNTSSEPAPTSLGNINKSGDLSVALPIVHAQGRGLQLPVNLTYTAGIKVEQKASEVGLGWAMPIGSIVRDYGAFEPDYTATDGETQMQSVHQGVPNGMLSNPLADLSPYSNNQDLMYDQVSAGMMPDNYHINVPGLGTGTFWNNGSAGGAHNFVLKEQAPWVIQFDVETYEVAQEFSRINEYNLTQPVSGSVDNSSSFAAAICVPPYVNNRLFSRQVVSDNSLSGPFGPQGNSAKVFYEDFKSFTIVAEDGTQYVFGRALRGQKYLLAESPFWSTMQDKALQGGGPAIRGEFWKIDYVAEWLLTEIRSYDYVDSNGNGLADDADDGDWIRIEYTDPEKFETTISGSTTLVPTHREWSNFSQTDRASSLMRERAYVKRIVTPIQEVLFEISPRYDVDFDYYSTPANYINNFDFVYANHALQSGGTFDIEYPVEVMRYDKAIVRDRLLEGPFYARNRVTRTVKLHYAEQGSAEQLAVSHYAIRDQHNNDQGGYDVSAPTNFNINAFYNANGRGKTTLTGVEIFPEDDLGATDSQLYGFEYGYNPSFDEVMKWKIIKATFFPFVRQSLNSVASERIVPILLTPFVDGKGNAHTDPYDVLSFVPFTTEEWKYENFHYNEVINYAENGILPVNPDLTADHTGFDPVQGSFMDALGYFNDPSFQGCSRAAWSLTKMTTPGGATIDYEYENDGIDYWADRASWTLKDNELPIVQQYNELAKQRSLRQGIINEGNDAGSFALPAKTLYRSYSMPLGTTSGGIRLKSKVVDGGIGPAQEVNYNYGTGHFTAVPADYWNNYLAGFSTFISQETRRHRHENNNYHYNAYYNQFNQFVGQNQFEQTMLPLVPNLRVHSSVAGEHYYESITETYANGASTQYFYRDIVTGQATVYQDQKLTAAKLGNTFGKDVFVIAGNEDQTSVPRLTRTDFKDNLGNAYKQVFQSFEVVDDFAHTFAAQGVSAWPGGTFQCFAILADGANPWAQYDPDDNIWPSTNSTANINGIFGMSPWQNFAGASNPPVYVGLENLKYSQSSVWLPGQTITDKHSCKIRVTESVEEYLDVQTKTTFEYEPTYGLLRSTTVENSHHNATPASDNKLISSTEYAFEAIGGNLFTNPHIINRKAAEHTYCGSVSAANQLNASSTTWQFSGPNLRPLNSFVYRDDVDPSGRISGFVPFNFTGSNPDSWEQRNSLLEYNRFGQPTLTSRAGLVSRSVAGYGSSLFKAEITFPEHWFDATYTGYEDLYEDLGNEDVTAPREQEFWYDANLTGPIAPVEGLLLAYYDNGSLTLYINDANGDFSVGDVVEFRGNPALTLIPGLQNLPAFQSSITSISNVGSPVSSDPFPTTDPALVQLNATADYSQHGWLITIADPFPADYPTGGIMTGIVIERQASDPRISNPSVWRARTGEFSYYLASKATASNPSQKSPFRPVLIKSWNGGNDPQQFDYKASVWVTRGASSTIQKSNALQQSGFTNTITNDERQQLIDVLNEPNCTDELKKNRLLVSSPLEDDVLLEMLNCPSPIQSEEMKEVLDGQLRLSDAVLISMIKKSTNLTASDLEASLLRMDYLSSEVFQALLDPNNNIGESTIVKVFSESANYPEESVLIQAIKRVPLISGTGLRDILIAHPSGLSGDVILALEIERPDVDPSLVDEIRNQANRGLLRLVYELWSEDRQTLHNRGTLDITNVGTGWKYVEMNIPVVKTAENQYLHVYVENDETPVTAQGGTSATVSKRAMVFLDDMLVYPAGAQYAYTSHDKLLNPTWLTDANDNSVRVRYDNWGRPTEEFDANGDLVRNHAYFQTSSPAAGPNWFQTETHIDYTSSSVVRQYADGLGAVHQTLVTEPAQNRSMLSVQEYNSMGWPAKSYNTLGLYGTALPNTLNSGYADDLEALYGSTQVFSEVEYQPWVGKSEHRLTQPRLSTEADRISETYDAVAAANEVTYGTVAYGADMLFKNISIDPKGNTAVAYTDKLGRMVAQKMPIGESYSFDANGATQWSGGAFEHAWTYFENDALGNRTKSIDPEGLETTMAYNSLGQVVQESHPDRGTTEYRYDSHGRLRFERDAVDAAAIADGSVADQFTYYVYDAWSRVVRSGKMRIPSGLVTTFNNPSRINDPDYPTLAQAGLEEHQQVMYDGPKSANGIGRVQSTRVLSEHQFNGTQYQHSKSDVVTYAYTNNGQVETETYSYDGLSGSHELSYQYNVAGLATQWTYSSGNPANDFAEQLTYDDLGRAIESSSGLTQTPLSIDSRATYDPLGFLRKRSLGLISGTTADFQETIVYRNNVRGQTTAAVGERFRYSLQFDLNGNIDQQLWSNTKFDNTPNIQHLYQYSYDPHNRLVGADYSTIDSDNDPYANYTYYATHKQGDFLCDTDTDPGDDEGAVDAVKSFNDATIVSMAQLGAGQLAALDELGLAKYIAQQVQLQADAAFKPDGSINPELAGLAIAALRKVDDAALADVQQTEEFGAVLAKILDYPFDTDQERLDLLAMEVLAMDAIDHPVEPGYYEQKTFKDLLFAVDSILEDTMPPQAKLNTLNELLSKADYDIATASIYVATLKSMLSAEDCEVNPISTSIFDPIKPLENPVITATTLYDGRYYYSRSGNVEFLRRYDNLGNYKHRKYNYATGGGGQQGNGSSPSNRLLSVDVNNGTSNTLGGQMAYDANGNLAVDPSMAATQLQYNIHNLPTRITMSSGDQMRYRYNAQGIRSVQTLPGGVEEYFVGPVILDAAGAPVRYSISAGYAEPAGGSLTKKYTLADWLGTVRLVLDDQGQTVSSRDHYPYGKLMPGRVFESDAEGKRFQFTGHEFDEETGYGYHGARLYNRDIGRYCGVDPLALAASDWTAYRYAFDNPINVIDPTGLYEDGYVNEDGEYVWNFEHSESSYTDKDGVEWNKVSDNFFEFSDIVRGKKQRMNFDGKLQLASADLDDITAFLNRVRDHHNWAGINDRAYLNSLVNLDGMSGSSKWEQVGGHGSFAGYVYKQDHNFYQIISQVPLPAQRVGIRMGLTEPPIKFSPVTGKQAEGSMFPQSRYESHPIAILLQAADLSVKYTDSYSNIILLKFNVSTSGQQTFKDVWKYVNRPWPK